MTPEEFITALDVPVAVAALLYTLHRLLALAATDLAGERDRQERLLDLLEVVLKEHLKSAGQTRKVSVEEHEPRQ